MRERGHKRFEIRENVLSDIVVISSYEPDLGRDLVKGTITIRDLRCMCVVAGFDLDRRRESMIA